MMISVRRFWRSVRRVLRPVRRAWRSASAPARERVALLRMPEPVTFNEKLRYKMLADRRPLLTTFTDKLAVRAYVASRVGADVLTDLYFVTDAPDALAEAELPREFVVKPTHASGACVVVARFAPEEQELPANDGWLRALVRPDRLNRDRLVALCNDWMHRPFSPHEWAYQNVPRRLLVEELLNDGGGVPPDYKFFVFHERARMIQVDFDRYEGHTRSLYTPDWERLDVEYNKPAGVDVERPPVLHEMLDIAETLGADTDFVRVDLYCLGTRIVFGELTNYPEAATGEFRPSDYDRQLGEWWTPPRKYDRST